MAWLISILLASASVPSANGGAPEFQMLRYLFTPQQSRKGSGFQLASCTAHYDECLARAEPYCKDETDSVAVVQRAVAYASCLETYIGVCKNTHCD